MDNPQELMGLMLDELHEHQQRPDTSDADGDVVRIRCVSFGAMHTYGPRQAERWLDRKLLWRQCLEEVTPVMIDSMDLPFTVDPEIACARQRKWILERMEQILVWQNHILSPFIDSYEVARHKLASDEAYMPEHMLVGVYGLAVNVAKEPTKAHCTGFIRLLKRLPGSVNYLAIEDVRNMEKSE